MAKKDEEGGEKKLPYPKSVFFIISTEFCERFSFYGMKTVLALFFNQVLNFNQNTSTVLYHAFTALCYFTPVIGAVIADSFVGKFRTIFYISIIYALGQATLTVGAIGNTEGGNEGIDGLPASALAFIGLGLIAFGTGGIKPCVASFGGEQFVLPEQAHMMGSYFSMFYASINGGSLIATVITPILRQNGCFGQESCYPLAFGVPAGLMGVAILLFLMGRIFNMYIMITPDENIIVKTTKCLWMESSFDEHSFSQYLKRRKSEKKDSWMDYGADKYGKEFIDDVKALGNVTYMFLPFPIFWALFDQQGSRWTFQATRMNGETFGYVILPDMMQVSNPVLILAFIPFFDYVVYPLFAKLKMLRTPLQRAVTGGVIAGLAFCVSAGLEFQLETTYRDLPNDGMMSMTMYNGLNCPIPKNITMYSKNAENPRLSEISFDFSNITTEHIEHLNAGPENVRWVVESIEEFDCNGIKFWMNETEFTDMSPPDKIGAESEYADRAQHVLLTWSFESINDYNEGDKVEIDIVESKYRDRLEKSDTGLPYVRLAWNFDFSEYGLNSSKWEIIFDSMSCDGDDFNLEECKVNVNEFVLPGDFPKDDDGNLLENTIQPLSDAPEQILKNVGHMQLRITHDKQDVINTFDIEANKFLPGANYQILVQSPDQKGPLDKDGKPTNILRTSIFHKITDENSVHIFWLLPQFVMITAAEILFSITTLQFSFTQAPESMKAVMMAIRMLTNAVGNIIDVVVISALDGVFDHQWQFFFLFAGLMFLDMMIFAWMATGYTYVDYTTKERKDDEDEDDKKSISYDKKEEAEKSRDDDGE